MRRSDDRYELNETARLPNMRDAQVEIEIIMVFTDRNGAGPSRVRLYLRTDVSRRSAGDRPLTLIQTVSQDGR